MVLGGQHGLQQRLAHLPPGVPVSEHRHQGRQVVAGRSLGAERRLVHTEEADHPERHPAERRQRRHGDPAPEEVGPAHPVVETLVQQLPDITELQRHRRGLAPECGGVEDLPQDPVQRLELPTLVPLGGEEGPTRLADALDPPGQGAGRGRLCGQIGQTAHDGSQAAQGLDVTPFHPMGGDVTDGEPEVLVEHRRADHEPIQGRLPGVGHDGSGKPEPFPLGGIEAPPHVGRLRPLADDAQAVIVEPEALPHRSEAQELQHRVHVEAAGHQLEKGRGGAQHRIGGPDGPVGQPVAQRRRAVASDARGRLRRGRGAGWDLGRGRGRAAEGRLDQRGEAVQ